MKRTKPAYYYIQSDAEVVDACNKLEKAERLAVDTEFVGEKYYFPKLEVLQISDGEEIYLIDIPMIKDLRPLANLLGNQRVLKIFHAADQDLPILKRALGEEPVPVFDTQIAASLLGRGAQISLANLVREITGERMSSKQSTSDWSQRPLSDDQLVYAAYDVLYLHRLHDAMVEALEKSDRLAWYEDEQQERLADALVEEEGDPSLLYRRVKDWMSLDGGELAILRELAMWRENTAREKNLPRRSILRDEALVELSRFQPADREAVKKLRRVNIGQVFRFYDDIRSCIATGKDVPKEDWPKKPVAERPDIPTGLLELCQALLRTEADRHQVAPSVVATTSDIQQVIARRGDLSENSMPLLHGWRRVVVGDKLLALLQGRVSVRVGEDGALVFEELGNRE